MVDLIPIKKLYQYASLQRQDMPEGRHYVYGEQKLPSVTTVLSATKKDKGALDPVERQATVLFVDLVGFTKLTEAKGPKATVDILNAYFDAATEIIGQHNGVVTQYQGDAILAIFNVPLENKDHPQHAFDASIEFLKTVGEKTFAGERLATRISLNSGPIIAGNVGGGGRQSYTVHGDTVNLAARLESLNKEHGTSLLVLQSTSELLKNSGLRKIGETEIRGLRKPIGLYALMEDWFGLCAFADVRPAE